MPRNASGTYTLPTGNPVVSGDIISSTWANDTMGDIASALTASLARDGSGGMTAALRVVDGSVSVPGLAFGNETGSGLYRSAAGDVGLAILGNQILRMRSTGLDVTGALSYTGTLTGGTGVINIGSGQFYKDASGNVGIGTGSPTSVLDVASAGGSPVISLTASGAWRYQILTDRSTQTFRIRDQSAGNLDRVTIDSSGNFGIGTSSPATKLHVSGTGSQELRLTANTSGDIRLGFDVSGAAYNWIDAYRATGSLAFATGNTERMRIDSNGNLLVGTTDSIAKLVVSGSLPNNLSRFINTNANPDGLLVQYIADPNNTTNNFFHCVSNTFTARLVVRSNGGIANYQANDVNISDRREKTNFNPAKNYLDVICAIPVQTFNYIDQNAGKDDGLTLGVVAQDVQAVAPELVMESNWGTAEKPKMRLSIYQTDLQYALMKCIQELKAEVDALKTTIH